MATSDLSVIPSARPTIIVDGSDDLALSQGLLGMSVHETVEGLHSAELRFGNLGAKDEGIGYLYFDRRKLDFGTSVQLKLAGDLFFDGRVSAIEGTFGEGRRPEVAVLLEDRFQDLRMTRRTRAFADSSDADVIQGIAGEHGLQAEVEVPGPRHKVIAQVNESDLAFLRGRARAAGAEVWVEGRTLHAKPRGTRGGAPLRLAYGNTLREFTALADLGHQRTSVQVCGWDVGGKSRIAETADEAAIHGELGSDSSGAGIVRDAFGERKESVAHMVPLTSDEAQVQAEAWFRTVARRFVVGRGLARPDGRLRVGKWVELAGLGALFDGKYYLAEVRHRFDGASGFRSEFTAERPGLGAAR